MRLFAALFAAASLCAQPAPDVRFEASLPAGRTPPAVPDGWIAESAEPVAIGVHNPDPLAFSAHVGRFYPRSRGELIEKLGQFPAGTRFGWEGAPLRRAEDAVFWRQVERVAPVAE